MHVDSEIKRNRAVVRALIHDVINAGRLDRLDELVAEDYVDRSGDQPVIGRDRYREMILGTREAFPDLVMAIEDEIASDDRVAVRLRWRATHHGEFLGIPPTGKTVEMTGIGILRLREGQVVERWNESDVLGLVEQLGATLRPS